jgi:hypothetical protein
VTLIGYPMMGEQAGPKQLVRDVALAEEAGGPATLRRWRRRLRLW